MVRKELVGVECVECMNAEYVVNELVIMGVVNEVMGEVDEFVSGLVLMEIRKLVIGLERFEWVVV